MDKLVVKRMISTKYFKNSVLSNIKVLRATIPNVHGPTADEVMKDVDLSSKVALITGANSGLGLQMSKALSARGCHVLMACRNFNAAKLAAEYVADGGVVPDIYNVNLESLASVRQVAEDIQKDKKKLDLVILNAAALGLPWKLTEDGLETTSQINFLAQYYLLMRLEPLLANDARVVVMSSESHRDVKWSPDEKLFPKESLISLPKEQYSSLKAYNVSKLCGVLMMHWLGHRWQRTKRGVFCACPGRFLPTNLARAWWPNQFLYFAMSPLSKSVSQGAATPLYCATSPELKGISAQYFIDCHRHAESEMACDIRLAYRVNDVVTDMLSKREKVETASKVQDIEPDLQFQAA